MPVEKICEICGKTFMVSPYRVKTARFCSQVCGGKWHHSQRPNMGYRFPKGNQLRKGLRPTNAFTSEQVQGENSPSWVEGETFVCENCGKSFQVKPWLVRQNGMPRYCSQKCFRAHCKGENDPRYVGGPKTYRGRGWRKARLLAVERDNGTCQRCGKHIGSSIPVHHIKPFRTFQSAQEANALENLICMCQSCHMKDESVLIPVDVA